MLRVMLADGPQRATRLGGAFIFRFGEALEEEHLEKPAVEIVAGALFAGRRLGEFVLRIQYVAVTGVFIFIIQKALALQEIDEHQAVEQD